MNRFMRILVFALAALCLVVAPARARAAREARPATITVTDDRGTTITLPAAPRRIISLAPNVTEILFALGLGREVVGVSSYSNYPTAAAKLPVVINYTSVSYEKILSLKPDLLVAAGIVPQAAIAKLRGLRLPVLVADPRDISGILGDLRLVGRAAGEPAVGNALAAGLQGRIDRIEAAVRRATTRPRVYYELDNTLYTAGRGSFVDSLITLAGGANVADSVASPYPQLSKEKLIALNPQDIILGDYYTGNVTVASVDARPGFAAISAVKLHHVYPFDDDLASRPGPRIVDGLGAMARLLHPGLFR